MTAQTENTMTAHNPLTATPQDAFLDQAAPEFKGAWYALDERLFKRRIARLAELACTVDGLKRHLLDPEQRQRLKNAVDELHAVAAHYDALGGYGLYADVRSPE